MTNVVPFTHRREIGFTDDDKTYILQIAESFSALYRPCYLEWGQTEEGDDWVCIFDNPDCDGEPSCRVFTCCGKYHHMGNFGDTVGTDLRYVMTSILPVPVSEYYEERFANA